MQLSPEQQAIQAKCFHPSGNFVEFPPRDVETSIPARFEKIAGQFPNRLAVKTGNRTLTYQEFNQATNRLSHAILEHRGEAPEPIALLMEHDASLFVAMMGVLKAGKICVVLEPTFPKARNSYLLEDSQAVLLLTDRANLSMAREYAHGRCRVVNVDGLDPRGSIDNPGLSIAADRFAFLVYTSGSTGQPKGVIQNQRNLLHDSRLYCNGLHVCTDDRVALLYSCSASQGLKVTFATLLNGAALRPYPVREKGVADLASWLNQEEITIYFSVPSLFRQFAESLAGQQRFPRLRIVQLGSDLVTRGELDAYRSHFSSATVLIVRFGTTETGTLRRMFFDAKSPLEEAAVPVGYGIEDTDISLHDVDGNEVRAGAVGEIIVKSRYLSPGYWQRPDLTRDCFSPDPNGGDRRIYRTGDLGRMRSDGLLYHLGRKDFQLNIRGYRVEAGEIEAVLQAQDNVKEAIVATVRTSSAVESERLIAYIVPLARPLPSIHALRAGVADKLPAYMVPSEFVFLASLPRTPNGKIDRRALPEPGKARPPLDIEFVAPQTDLETKLTELWERILDVRPIGIHDNFFELGGHSLIATRLVAEVTRHFQSDMPLRFLFQSPTVAGMSALIREIKPGSADTGNAGDSLSIRPIPRDRKLDLSFAQRRMWFLHQLEPESPVYNQFRALRLRGPLNCAVLRKALDTIVGRHEVLRTTYSCVDDQPVQTVHPNGRFPLTVIELSDIPSAEREDALTRHARDFCRRPFDLREDRPVRGELLHCADDEHVLVLVTHHIASDGWSNDILFKELSALYEAFGQGKASPLEDLPFQYADYAVWQKERLRGDLLQQQLAYWQKQLWGLSLLEMPTDRPRPRVLKHDGRTKRFRLSQALAERLKELSSQAQTTLSMTLLAAFQTLLHRYTGQDDIAVGSPIAGRNHVETEQLIGFFVNTLVLRGDLSGNLSFRELLGRMRRNALDAYGCQDLPFEKLVEELSPERDLSRNPFVQVMFQLRNYPNQTIRIGTLSIEEYQIDSGLAKFDLSMSLREDDSGLAGSLEYRTDLFDATTIERVVGHFQTLLEGIVANPDQRIGELPLLTEAEKQRLLVEWNQTKSDYPKDKCIHTLFEERVEKAPDAIAVVFEDQQLTYRELNQSANRLAHRLVKLGVGPDVLVGLCLERSIEMVVAILGILKAGGAYLPLDPSYPKERLAFTLEDTQVNVLLSHSRFRNRCSSYTGAHIAVDLDWTAVAGEKVEPPAIAINPENLAYVIYTSGSTGTPKGVAIQHRALCNHMHWLLAEFPMSDADRVLLKTPLGFDASVWEIFAPLLSGARLVIARPDGHKDSSDLVQTIIGNQITVLQLVPSLLGMLLQEVNLNRCTSLKNVFCGGEKLPNALHKQFTALMDLELINLYGPTEACIDATYWRHQAIAFSDEVPIGKPIANTQVYILDAYLNPVPIGAMGELHIGGVGLARGYLNRPELTQEKFIANPFSKEPGARLYKTGDLARYLPDGNIEFLCRIDTQVKIRGHRIELGEIEAVLAQHPAIQQALVLDREDTPGDKRLVGYVVSANGSAPSTHDLSSYLQQKLPEHMVPAAFVFLDSLPLTPNGKLDRKSLPAPDRSRPELENAFATPRTPVEEILANIWAEVLKIDQVGIHDNFFHLGGHSLLATQVVSRIRQSLKLDLPLRFFFESPTIEGLARKLQSIEVRQEKWDAVQIPPVAREQYRTPKNQHRD